MIELTRAQIGELRRCNPATVSRAKLPRTASGKYDLLDPEVWQFVSAPTVEEALASHKRAERSNRGTDDESIVELEREELEEKIRYTRERADERALMNAVRRKDLFHRDLVLEYFSGFASGLRTYILPIPQRVAPRLEAAIKSGSDDVIPILESEIRDGIERAVSLGKQALDHARSHLDEDDDDDDSDLPGD